MSGPNFLQWLHFSKLYRRRILSQMFIMTYCMAVCFISCTSGIENMYIKKINTRRSGRKGGNKMIDYK